MALKKSQLYSSLWQSCDELRGGMDASQYKDYVLTLLFMKYVSDKYTEDPYPVIDVPEGGRFVDMVACVGQKDIGDRINKIIGRFAEANDLKGVIDQADFNDESKLGRGKAMQDRLSKLVAIFDNLDFSTNRAGGDDLLGDAYEYLMRHFATQSGKDKGQFYTPAEVSRIMAKVIGIGPETGQDCTIYDPTCGSGSLLLKAADEAPRGLTIYGQEMDNATWGLARMNMILHGHPTAELAHGNTLADPQFTSDRGLKTFDFAVANPPFSTKSWSNGFDPSNDQFRRFEYGIPPNKNGDYAFLLHLVKSLKSHGRGAIICPHGVLFRGNREAVIRRNLIDRGLISGVIGLPANLFYGTGIPACIVVFDKEHRRSDQGIFMIDASKGFAKDGAKNRLRERDICRIVDVFRQQLDVPNYSCVVPFTKLCDPTNDYSLNLPRYIDSREPEDIHDLDAHLNGGIPDRDLDTLNPYWKVFPSLRATLFKPTRPGYSDCTSAPQDVMKIVVGHDEFKSFVSEVAATLKTWCDTHRHRLQAISGDTSPKCLLDEMANDLLVRFAEFPLLDRYNVYQRLMDYWIETMQDDVLLIAAEGWVQAIQPRHCRLDGRGKLLENPDLVVKHQKWKMDLLPPDLVVARYFASERATIQALKTDLEVAERKFHRLLEEHTGEGRILEHAVDDQGKITKRQLTDLSKMEHSKEDQEVHKECLRLHALTAKTRRAAKNAQRKLDANVLARYTMLTELAVKDIITEDKWFGALYDAADKEIKSTTEHIILHTIGLLERYARPMSTSTQDVTASRPRIVDHIQAILDRAGVSNTDHKAWELSRLDQLVNHHSGNSTLIKGQLASSAYPGLYPGYSASGQDVWHSDYEHHGDALVVSAVGSRCGRVFLASGKWVAIANTHVIWPDRNRLDIRFLRRYLDDENFWLKGGTGQPYVLFKQSLAREFRLPGLAEQRMIADIIDDVDQEIERLTISTQKMHIIKHGMIQQLLTGQVRLVEPMASPTDDVV